MNRIDLKKVAYLMNRCCDTNLNVAEYEGKYLTLEGDELVIKEGNVE